MLEAPSPSFRTQGDTAWFFDPINRSQIWYEYLGSASPIQFTEHKPVFHANLGYMPDRDLRLVQIIRLKQKTDRREARLSWSTGDMLARFSGTVPVMLAQAADGVFTITPQSDLEKGEYLLSFGRMMMKYDFGVR